MLKVKKGFALLCHPEHSEGSRCWRRYSDAPVGYAPAALRFFASLRFAQNDKVESVRWANPFGYAQDRLLPMLLIERRKLQNEC
jgi:hypothetical protein